MNHFDTLGQHSLKKSEKAIYAMVPYFHDAILFGDSLAESILDYRLLRKNNVIAKRGRCIDMIDGDLLLVYALQPKVLFMEFGKNDIHHFHGDEQRFIDIYKKQIDKLFDHGITNIYINSIIPVRSDILAFMGGKDVVERFNAALMTMCEELQLPFIDNSRLMNWSYEEFEYDGIHPKYPYYTKWLWNLIHSANLEVDS